jgi:hypothetical protein
MGFDSRRFTQESAQAAKASFSCLRNPHQPSGFASDPVDVELSLPRQRLGDLSEGLKVVVSSDAYQNHRDLDQAISIATRIPTIRVGGSIEVRPVISDSET